MKIASYITRHKDSQIKTHYIENEVNIFIKPPAIPAMFFCYAYNLSNPLH